MARLRTLFAILIFLCGTRFVLAQEPPPLELVVQTAHTDTVRCTALSGDGKLALSGSYDRTAILWDTATGKKLRTFAAPSIVGGVALSDDGKVALTATRQAAVLWETASGKVLQSLSVQGSINPDATALSGDGKLVLIGLTLWDAVKGEQIRTLEAAKDRITGVALSGDGQLALVVSDGAVVLRETAAGGKSRLLWDVNAARALPGFNRSRTHPSSAALSGDGKFALAGFADGTAMFWDTATGKKLQVFPGHSTLVGGVGLSRDGKRALTASQDRTAVVWDTADGTKVQTFRGHSEMVNGAALSGDGKLAFTGSHDRAAILWDAATGKELHAFRGHHGVERVAVSGDGTFVLTGSQDNSAKLWGLAAGKQLTLPGHAGPVRNLALSGDGKFAVTCADEKSAIPILWDTATGKQLQTFEGQTRAHCTAMSADGKLTLIGSGMDRTMVLWETPGGKKLQSFPLEGNCLALSGDGKLLLTGSLTLRETADGKQVRTFGANPAGTPRPPFPAGPRPPVVKSVALSGDGKVALSGSDDGTATVWDSFEGTKLQTFHAHTSPITSVALSRDGRHALTGAENGIAILWDTPGGIRLVGHTHTITSVALSDDGKHAWTTSADGTTRAWDPVTGKERCRLYAFDAGKDWLVVTPDGRFDGSEGAWRFIAYREPGTLKLADEDTRKQFHRPGLLKEIGGLVPTGK